MDKTDKLATCQWCEQGDKPNFLDQDGTLVSITGENGILCHAHEEYWWPCLKFGVELHCSRASVAAPPPDDYVAWCRYDFTNEETTGATIHLCDSDAEGAFKVYRTSPVANTVDAETKVECSCCDHPTGFLPAVPQNGNWLHQGRDTVEVCTAPARKCEHCGIQKTSPECWNCGQFDTTPDVTAAPSDSSIQAAAAEIVRDKGVWHLFNPASDPVMAHDRLIDKLCAILSKHLGSAAVGEPPAALRNAAKLCRSGEGRPKVELHFNELKDAQAVHKWLTSLAATPTSIEDAAGGGGRST